MKLAVFLPNWIGDAVMCTPALRAMRRHLGPSAHITGIMRPYVAGVLEGTPWLDESLFYLPRAPDKQLGARHLIRQLRRRKIDVLVMMTNSLRTCLLGWLGGAKERIGYARDGRWFLTNRLRPPENAGRRIRHPMVDYYLDLAYALGCPRESPRLELATTKADECHADLVWSQLGLRDDQRVIVLNSSGAFGASKCWPAEYTAGLARRIAQDLEHDVLILCGPKERDVAQRIVQDANHPGVVSLANHPLSIGLSKACIRRGRLMVTTDSGPRHFAVAFGVPVIGLFGPTPPIWGENPTAREVRLSVDLDCLGCHERTCPLEHHRCMRDLSVQRVFRAVAQELGTEQQTSAA